MSITALGLRPSLVILLLAAGLAGVFRDGTVETLGPLVLTPPLAFVMTVPYLIALAVGIAHLQTGTPIIVYRRRVFIARAVSFFGVLALGLATTVVAGAVSHHDVGGAAVRNVMWLSGLTLLARSLGGVSYAWIPAVLSYGIALVSPVTADPWTVHGMTFGTHTTGGQFWVAGALLAAGFAVAVADPLCRDYLRTSTSRLRGRRSAPNRGH